MNGLVFINLCEYVKCVSTTKGYLLTTGNNVKVVFSAVTIWTSVAEHACVRSHSVTVGGSVTRAAQLAAMFVLD